MTLLTLLLAFLSLEATSTPTQSACQGDSTRVAQADTLLEAAGELFEDPGTRASKEIFKNMRKAVELAPLTKHRWAIIRQLAAVSGRLDTTVTLAKLAKDRWPLCAMSDSALADATALVENRRARHN
jgi:hypothetical protein